MDWNEYKRLCDSPPVFSRWMLEQSIELLQTEPRLAVALGRVLADSAIEKPNDHRGDGKTDMFFVTLSVGEANDVVSAMRTAIEGGRTTVATRARGLGGFLEAWREYANYVERANDTNGEEAK